MKVKGQIPAQTVEDEFDTDDPKTAVTQFKEKHPKARLESVNDKFIHGECMECGALILHGDKNYGYDHECDAHLCTACFAEERDRPNFGRCDS